MPEPITPERLAEIREREHMATEGPWIRWPDQENIPGWDGFCVIGDDAAEGEECNPTARVYTESDAEFIAHARRDVPDLLDEVDRLNAQIVTYDRLNRVAIGDWEREVDRLNARIAELTSLLNDPDRLALHALELRAIYAEADADAERDRLADGGDL